MRYVLHCCYTRKSGGQLSHRKWKMSLDRGFRRCKTTENDASNMSAVHPHTEILQASSRRLQYIIMSSINI